MRATWSSRDSTQISVPGELDALIETIRRSGRPTMIFLEADTGHIVVFGVGSPESVMTYVQPDDMSFHSLGDVNRKGHLRFWCRDQIDDFMAEMAIPEAVAIAAAHAFLATGERPGGVVWEADWDDAW